ncbi:MAG: hypothetical protein U0M02_13870 [Acutalibacteraceae bacterium]|nr:hypothetical protein [Acutalibacteraceae bacterium]
MKMVSEYGNVIKTVKSPNEVKRLKELGYTELKEEPKQKKAKKTEE